MIYPSTVLYILNDFSYFQGSDYINASYIDTYTQKKSFIATQAPLVGTVSDFWRMIYENESWVIVMLGQEIEKGQVKLHFILSNLIFKGSYTERSE